MLSSQIIVYQITVWLCEIRANKNQNLGSFFILANVLFFFSFSTYLIDTPVIAV